MTGRFITNKKFMTKKQTLVAIVAILVVAVVATVFLSGGELLGMMFKSNPSLTVSLDAGTPYTSILVAGESNQPVAVFKLASVNDVITVDSLSLNCMGSGGSPGDADNNISTVRISSGNVSKASYFTNGIASFSGLNLVVPKDGDIKLNVSVDLNTILGGATSSEHFRFSVGDVKATGTSSRVLDVKNNHNESKNMYVYETEPSLKLDPTSPSGNRVVSTSDKVLIFNVGVNKREKLNIEKIGFELSSDGSFSTGSSVPAYLKDLGVATRDGVVVASGMVSVKSNSQAEVELLPTGNLEIVKGGTATYALVLDTGALLDEEGGVDDLLTVCLNLSTTPEEDGSFWWNDTNVVAKWMDGASITWKIGGAPYLCGNLLKY